MLLIRHIEIENFVCFEKIEIEPSTDPDQPLTVIRAENGSGKTTLLRAIRWGMYGEMGLPGNASQFSLHPVDWNPNAEGIRTRVAIFFETDGSSRNHHEGNATNTAYELTRSVRTIAQNPTYEGAPNFRRVDERTQLMVQELTGEWSLHQAGVSAVVAELLPSNLRDFFVMDADEAADFVGGSENKIIQRQEVINKTSFAVRALLGLDVFEDATERIQKIAEEFGRAATKAIGDDASARQQEELDRRRKERDEFAEAVDRDRKISNEVEDGLNRARDRLEEMVGDIGKQESLKKRLIENRKNREKFVEMRRERIGQLSSQLSSIDLYASLAAADISRVRALLQPMYDDGSIPSRHISFVQGLIERGVCVCGQRLDEENEFKHRVHDLLSKSQGKEGIADYLAEVLVASNTLHQFDGGTSWESRCESLEQQIADLDSLIGDSDQIQREIDNDLKKVDNEEVQNTRDEIDMLEKQKHSVRLELDRNSESLDRCKREINELDGKLRTQQKRQREARDDQACQQTSTVLTEILNQAYGTIRDAQVEELDRAMNGLFGQMAANVSDEDARIGGGHKTTLRMIEQVGLKRLEGDSDEFEIYALNRRGSRYMPPTEINGASRRILALSFVLALCSVSRTYAPLVADSLLNFLSGLVRTNTLRVTAETSRQPILLLTGADLEAQREVDLVARYAGATYTLTGQWQHTSHDGDVVNLTDNRSVSLICKCGPREFCNVCERVGHADSIGWTKRTTSEIPA